MSNLSKFLAKSIMRDLQQGYGVEDISVRGTATPEQTRHVIEIMRKNDMLGEFYKTARKRWKTNASNNNSGKRR